MDDLATFFMDRIKELENELVALSTYRVCVLVKGRIELTKETLDLNRELLKRVLCYKVHGSFYEQ